MARWVRVWLGCKKNGVVVDGLCWSFVARVKTIAKDRRRVEAM